MNRIRPLSLICLVALGATAFAALQQTYSLQRTAKVGDEAKYSFKAEMQFGDIKIEVRGKNSEKIVKIGEDGTMTVESIQSDVVVKTPDEEQPIPDVTKATMSYGKDRVITTYSDEDGEGDSASLRLALITSIQAPKEAMKLGDSWTATIKKIGEGTYNVDATFKLVGTEKVGKYETIKIELKSKELEADEAAEATGTVWLNVADFSTVKEEISIKSAPIAMAPAPVDMKLTSERVD